MDLLVRTSERTLVLLSDFSYHLISDLAVVPHQIELPTYLLHLTDLAWLLLDEFLAAHVLKSEERLAGYDVS